MRPGCARPSTLDPRRPGLPHGPAGGRLGAPDAVPRRQPRPDELAGALGAVGAALEVRGRRVRLAARLGGQLAGRARRQPIRALGSQQAMAREPGPASARALASGGRGVRGGVRQRQQVPHLGHEGLAGPDGGDRLLPVRLVQLGQEGPVDHVHALRRGQHVAEADAGEARGERRGAPFRDVRGRPVLHVSRRHGGWARRSGPGEASHRSLWQMRGVVGRFSRNGHGGPVQTRVHGVKQNNLLLQIIWGLPKN